MNLVTYQILGFNLNVARDLAARIVNAYTNTGPAVNLVDKPTSSDSLPLYATGMLGKPCYFGCVEFKDGNAYVSIRGTVNPQDWLSNLDFEQVWLDPEDQSKGKVEKGFHGLYQQLVPFIVSSIVERSLDSRIDKIYVTGHSLGAAIATLISVHPTLLKIRKPILYTFASPRVGCPVFAQYFESLYMEAWRVVNTEDVITTMPLATPVVEMLRLPKGVVSLFSRLRFLRSFNFQHVGFPICFTVNSGSIVANHSMTDLYLPSL